jgi:hypothetical protein
MSCSGTHASSGWHAGGVRTQRRRQIDLSHEPSRLSALKTDRSVHPLNQLPHDVQTDAATTAARMSHKEFA